MVAWSEARTLVPLALAAAVGIAGLVALGTWQVQRLQWKTALIDQVRDGAATPPLTLEAVIDRTDEIDTLEYRRLALRGEFDHASEQYRHAVHQGRMGWYVYTPLKTGSGPVVFVNRGFVPGELRDPASRAAGLLTGPVDLVGLVRAAPAAKPNTFVPDGDPAKSEFYWPDLDGMRMAAGLGPDRTVAPFFVDADATPVPGGWPKGGVTRIRFTNNHLQYAVTWYGLAAALAAVFVAFVRSRLRREPDGRPDD